MGYDFVVETKPATAKDLRVVQQELVTGSRPRIPGTVFEGNDGSVVRVTKGGNIVSYFPEP